MTHKIEFEGLKFKSSIKFKNNVEKGKYFNDLLVKSIDNYREKMKEYFVERLQIIFSYAKIFHIIKFPLLIPAIFTLGIASYIFMGLAILSFLIGVIYDWRFKRNIETYVMITVMNDNDELLELIRQDLIKYEKTQTIKQ